VIIRGAMVYTEQFSFQEEDIYILKDRIVTKAEYEKANLSEREVIDAAGMLAIPGLVDLHFHGAVGHDFCDATLADLHEIAEYEARQGIVAICPATMTYPEERLNQISDVAAEFVRQNDTDVAKLVGIHMEGPFISTQKLGAQNPEYVQKPDALMVRRLQKRSGNLFRIVDIAPEVEGAREFIREMRGEVKLSIAHSAATYEDALWAFENGVSHLTHMYNGMPGINHRQPGPILAALENHAEVELITDGIHIHDAMVRFSFRVFGADRIILIADSMEATGLEDGTYQLGGQKVTKVRNKAVLTEDPQTIAGSVTNLFDCMKTAVLKMSIPMEEAVRAASYNPAKALGIEQDYGFIGEGKKASLILMDKSMNRKIIIVEGKVI